MCFAGFRASVSRVFQYGAGFRSIIVPSFKAGIAHRRSSVDTASGPAIVARVVVSSRWRFVPDLHPGLFQRRVCLCPSSYFASGLFFSRAALPFFLFTPVHARLPRPRGSSPRLHGINLAGSAERLRRSRTLTRPSSVNPFTPKSDQSQISPAASPEI